MTVGEELQTPRLSLRPLSLAHLESMLPLISARDVAATTLRIPHPYTREDAEQYFSSMEKLIDEGTMLRRSIFVRSTDEYCGSVGLHIEKEHGRAEMGYWIGVPYWGRGYASEAARAIVEYGLRELGLNRIYATVFGGNTASRRVAENAGMTYEGCMKQHVKKWGEYKDLEIFAVLATEYRQPSSEK